MHNYGVFQRIKDKKHFYSKKRYFEPILIIDGFGDPYDADVAREQIEKKNPKDSFFTDEIEEEYEMEEMH